MEHYPIDFTPPPSELLNEEENIKLLQKLYNNVTFHGTGKIANGYANGDKSQPTGKLVDVLESVLTEGLQPQADILSILLLPIKKTISLTRHRIYARIYAERFGQNQEQSTSLNYTFGKSKDWEKYYFSACKKNILTSKNLILLPTLATNFVRYRKEDISLGKKTIKEKQARDGNKLSTLRKNINESIKEVQKFHEERWHRNRVICKENYPMIFAVDESTIKKIQLPHGLDLFEDRTGNTIPPQSIKFIEVPTVNVKETNALIEKIRAKSQTPLPKIPVIPMEYGEVISYLKGVDANLTPTNL